MRNIPSELQTTKAIANALIAIADGTLRCLQHDDEICEGEVEKREPLSATGVWHPRCDFHWEERQDKQAKHLENYPDSPNAPAWFDPTAAGERWNDDY
jgi:hypothetical protein